MQEARRAAKTAERDAQNSEAPGWQSVAGEAVLVLTTQGKDMEAAAALLEAQVRLEGINGLAQAAFVVEGLVTRFWGQLYPAAAPGEDPVVECLRPLTGLGRGVLTRPLNLLPLFSLADGSDATLMTFTAALAIDGLTDDERQRQVATGTLTSDALAEQASRHQDELARLAHDASEALLAWRAMEAVLEAKAERHKPPTRDVHDTLEQIATLARRLVPAPPVAEADPIDPAAAVEPAVTARPLSSGGAGPIATREEALRRLAEVAAWFRRTEPHSPLSYTLEDAVRRGRMGLPDLLTEIIGDYGERARILTALGIRPPPESIE